MPPMENWLWIPITIFSGATQIVRNASQKSLTRTAGTLGATFVRFAFGLPFTVVGLAIVLAITALPLPRFDGMFFAWVVGGGMAQLAATALLLASMEHRSFIVSMAYSKTEVLQIAVFSALILGEWVSVYTGIAMALGTAGVLMMSLRPGQLRSGSPRDWFSTVALLGMGSGAGFALSAVCFRGAILETGSPSPWLGAACTLLCAQIVQSLVLGAWLVVRDRRALVEVGRSWKVSLLAGMAGSVSSLGWFTAFGMRNAADVRTLGMIEMVFGYIVSHVYFKEKTTSRELIGILLLAAGLVLLCLQF